MSPTETSLDIDTVNSEVKSLKHTVTDRQTDRQSDRQTDGLCSQSLYVNLRRYTNVLTYLLTVNLDREMLILTERHELSLVDSSSDDDMSSSFTQNSPQQIT